MFCGPDDEPFGVWICCAITHMINTNMREKTKATTKGLFYTNFSNKTGAYNRNGEKFFDKSILVSILSEIIKQLEFWSFLTSFGIVRILLCESICKLLIVIPIGLNNPE